jgi:hypothetical protein
MATNIEGATTGATLIGHLFSAHREHTLQAFGGIGGQSDGSTPCQIEVRVGIAVRGGRAEFEGMESGGSGRQSKACRDTAK